MSEHTASCDGREQVALEPCLVCGSGANRVCERCGFGSSVLARFCGGCGLRLPGLGGAETLSETMDGALAHRLREPVTPEERGLAHATVLFADTVDSFGLIRDREPEFARCLLETIIHEMKRAVRGSYGVVSQILGDGVMALFTPTAAHPNHARDGCRAALGMHEAVAAFDWCTLLPKGPRPQLRVGLNTGQVVSNVISSDVGTDYRAVGATVHIAARMEQSAQPGTTRITAATRAHAGSRVSADPLGRVPVRGSCRQVEVFELADCGPCD